MTPTSSKGVTPERHPSLTAMSLLGHFLPAVALALVSVVAVLAPGTAHASAEQHGKAAPRLRVPNLVGEHAGASLEAHLRALGFSGFGEIVYVTASTAALDGVIIRQRPQAGAPVRRHAKVDIWVLKYRPAQSPTQGRYSANIHIVDSNGNDASELVLPPTSSGASSTTYHEIVTYSYPCVSTPGYEGDGLILNISPDNASTYISTYGPAVANTDPIPGEMKLTCGGTHHLSVSFDVGGWECSGKITFDAEVIKDRQPSTNGRYSVLDQVSLPFIDNSGNGFCP